jgi:hypothetical protein
MRRDCVELLSTPACDDRLLVGPDPDRILREEVGDDLQIRRIADIEQRRSGFHMPSLRRMICRTTPLTGAVTDMHSQSSRRLRIS